MVYKIEAKVISTTVLTHNMKTWTVLSRSLWLVALLAVPWAAAAPRQADPGNGGSEDQLMSYFEDHPDAAVDLFPDLVNQATSIELTVEDDVVADLIEKKTAQEIQDEKERKEANRGRKKRSVEFNFSGATLESGLNFQGVGRVNDQSTVDWSKHNSNNRNDTSHKDWSTHDSSRKDWSTHDSSRKDWSTHDLSHKDWSSVSIDASHKDYSQSHTRSDTRNNHALFGWGK